MSHYVTRANEMVCRKGLLFCFFHPLRMNIFYNTHFPDSFYFFFHLSSVVIDSSYECDVCSWAFSRTGMRTADAWSFDLPGLFRWLRPILLYLHWEFWETSALCSKSWVNFKWKTVSVSISSATQPSIYILLLPKVSNTPYICWGTHNPLKGVPGGEAPWLSNTHFSDRLGK